MDTKSYVLIDLVTLDTDIEVQFTNSLVKCFKKLNFEEIFGL